MIKRITIWMLVMVMLAAVGCSKKEETAHPAEAQKVAEQLIEAYVARDYATRFDLYCYDARSQWEDEKLRAGKFDSEEAFCADAQQGTIEQGLDYTIENFDDWLYVNHQMDLYFKKETYGDYTLTVTTVGCTKKDEQTTKQIREDLLAFNGEYADAKIINTITEAYTVRVHAVIDGDIKDWEETYDVHVVRCDDRWLVASHDI